MAQIAIMDAIYSGASATMVALDGTSADKGLPRVGGAAPAVPQTVLDFGRAIGGSNSRLASEMSPLKSQRARGSWARRGAARRGWTFQEGILSKRHVYFTRHQVYFACRRMTCQESQFDAQVLDDDDGETESAALLYLDRPGPEALQPRSRQEPWDVYAQLAGEFFGRKFTQWCEILNAFTGILTRLAAAADGFRAGFVQGLPRSALRDALLWEPDGRLAPYEYAWRGATRNLSFPSWTWAAWEWDVLPVSWRLPRLGEDNDDDDVCRGKDLPPLRFWDASGVEILGEDERCHKSGTCN